MVENDEVDWALGEAIALGSVVLEGTMSGSPARTPGEAPSANVTPCSWTTRRVPSGYPSHISTATGVGRFAVHDSLLSEYAALGFEYGYSVDAPDALVCWEAQFGDFANGAQVIIDNFLVAAEDKWGQRCGLVMLLPSRVRGPGTRALLGADRAVPHAVCEGQPESSRNPRLPPSTSTFCVHRFGGSGGQPLVVMTPKSLLRAEVVAFAGSKS